MKEFKNILVVRTDRIGDIVLTTPSLKQLRNLYPQAKISLLVSSLIKDLMCGNPYVDEIIVDDRKKMHKGIMGFWKLASQLKKKRFDLAIIYHTKKRTNALCALAGIPVRVGYRNNKYGFLLTHPLWDLRSQGKFHESIYCLQVLTHLPDVQFSLENVKKEEIVQDLFIASDSDSDVWANILFEQQSISGQKPIIAIHAGASDKEKRCSIPLFVDLIKDMIERYEATILLVGAPYIKDVSIDILSLVEEKHREKIIDLVGVTTLMQLVSVLKKTSILISNDSGPVHLASALNLPVISLFIRNLPGINPERWHPLGSRSRVIAVPPQNSGDQPSNFDKSLNLGDFKNPEGQDFITKDRILEEVDSLFKL